MPIRFIPKLTNHGFDPSPNPNWQMVPVGYSRTLMLSGVGDLVPVARNRALVEVKQTRLGNQHQLVLKGLKSGKTIIDWGLQSVTPGAVGAAMSGIAGHPRPGTSPSVATGGKFGGVGSVGQTGNPTGFQLDVSVKRERQIKTAFHYVDDGHDQKTSRKMADLDKLIAAANIILDLQANVRIIKKSAGALKIDKDLGKVVTKAVNEDGKGIIGGEWNDVVAGAMQARISTSSLSGSLNLTIRH